MNEYTLAQDTLSQYSIFGNTLWQYIVAVCVFFGSLIVLKIFQSVILSRLRTLAKKTKTDFDDALLEALGRLGSWFYIAISLLIAGRFLDISQKVVLPSAVLLFFIIIKEVIQSVGRMIDYSMELYLRGRAGDSDRAHTESMVRIFRGFVILVLWSIALVMLLSNLGVDVTSLIASLGIGGLAVALALQSVLSDVFSSFSIFIDKPFQVGDYISLGPDSAGTVQHIGLKTTRLKTLRGEELVVPNRELTTAKVQNFKKLETRRELFTFCLRYDTPQKKLEKIPEQVGTIISGMEQTSFTRCHLIELGESGLLYECVYNVDTSDYLIFSNIREKILLALHEMLQKQKVALTYPTRTILMEK